MPDYSQELQIAINAARQAATIVKEINEQIGFDIKLKGKNDLVTDADLASEKKIIEVIKDSFPDDAILAEETSQKEELPDGRVWIIDPIDGTTNFAHGFPVYCVSIALWEKGSAKVGLVLEMANDELFTAVEGQGAYLNDKRITVSDTQDPGSSLIGTGFPYNDLGMSEHYLEMLHAMMKQTHGIRRPGSAAWDLCNVACGRFEGFYEYGLSPWDVAAGALIVSEAGGIVTDWKGEGDWLFGKRIIAGNKPIRSFLEKEIQKCFESHQLKV